MLKYGEFSPNNPKMRVTTQPYLGLGEYEGRRQYLLDERKTEYQQYAEKIKKIAEQDNTFIKNSLKDSRPASKRRSLGIHKAVQTDIQDINTKLIQCEIPRDQSVTIPDHKIRSPRNRGVTIDKVQIETQNNIIVPGYNKYLDKAAAKNNSPRAKLMADLQSSYFPTMLGCTAPAIDDTERLEKVRRQEQYLAELRQQIDEKQHLLQKHKSQEKYERDLETRNLESQLREASVNDKAILNQQSYSADITESKIRRSTASPNSKSTITNCQGTY